MNLLISGNKNVSKVVLDATNSNISYNVTNSIENNTDTSNNNNNNNAKKIDITDLAILQIVGDSKEIQRTNIWRMEDKYLDKWIDSGELGKEWAIYAAFRAYNSVTKEFLSYENDPQSYINEPIGTFSYWTYEKIPDEWPSTTFQDCYPELTTEEINDPNFLKQKLFVNFKAKPGGVAPPEGIIFPIIYDFTKVDLTNPDLYSYKVAPCDKAVDIRYSAYFDDNLLTLGRQYGLLVDRSLSNSEIYENHVIPLFEKYPLYSGENPLDSSKPPLACRRDDFVYEITVWNRLSGTPDEIRLATAYYSEKHVTHGFTQECIMKNVGTDTDPIMLFLLKYENKEAYLKSYAARLNSPDGYVLTSTTSGALGNANEGPYVLGPPGLKDYLNNTPIALENPAFLKQINVQEPYTWVNLLKRFYELTANVEGNKIHEIIETHPDVWVSGLTNEVLRNFLRNYLEFKPLLPCVRTFGPPTIDYNDPSTYVLYHTSPPSNNLANNNIWRFDRIYNRQNQLGNTNIEQLSIIPENESGFFLYDLTLNDYSLTLDHVNFVIEYENIDNISYIENTNFELKDLILRDYKLNPNLGPLNLWKYEDMSHFDDVSLHGIENFGAKDVIKKIYPNIDPDDFDVKNKHFVYWETPTERYPNYTTMLPPGFRGFGVFSLMPPDCRFFFTLINTDVEFFIQQLIKVYPSSYTNKQIRELNRNLFTNSAELQAKYIYDNKGTPGTVPPYAGDSNDVVLSFNSLPGL